MRGLVAASFALLFFSAGLRAAKPGRRRRSRRRVRRGSCTSTVTGLIASGLPEKVHARSSLQGLANRSGAAASTWSTPKDFQWEIAPARCLDFYERKHGVEVRRA